MSEDTTQTPRDQPVPSAAEVVAVVERFASDNGLEAEPGGRAGEIVVVLPGEQKLKTVCSLIVGEHDVSVSAFVIRHPDENELAVHRHLLRANLRLPGLAYALDADGDVFVVGRLPLVAVDAPALDRLFGVVLQAADATFNDLLAMGFLTSMRKEWRWRVSRGESLRNLEAFRDLLDVEERAEEAADEAGAGAEPQRASADVDVVANATRRTPDPAPPQLLE